MEHEQEMALQGKFPSGSKWGPKELDAVRFALEPEEQDFTTFECDVTLSSANRRILARLADIFAIPVESLQNGDVTAPFQAYRAFYKWLAEVLRPEVLSDTSLTPPTRFEIRYNTSSPYTAEEQPRTPTAVPSDFGSPESSPAAGALKRKIRKTSTISPSRNLDPAMSTSQERITTASGFEYMADESLPTLPEGGHRVSLEKPFRTEHGSSSQFHPAGDDNRTSSKSEEEPSPSSSQTSSSYAESSPRLPSNIVRHSNVGVPEDEVVAMFSEFFEVICAEHEMTGGISFATDYGRDLVISIDGEFVHTRPDLRLSVTLSGESVRIPILDYEGKRLSGKPKFAQRVSEMLGRCCFQKAGHYNKSSYRPYLISAHNTEMSISTCQFRDSYLDDLNSDPELLKARELIQVTEYGPIDIREPEKRVLAAQNVYKLMLQLAERARKDKAREAKRAAERLVSNRTVH